MSRILAIETSCDETAAAVVENSPTGPAVRSSVVSSQIALHAKWGGVVPNLAAREHTKNIMPVVEAALAEAKCTPDDLDAIAVTEGPGLMPALLVGVTAAKTLALVWDKPLLGIHHLEGHIYANFISSHNDKFPISNSKSNPNEKNSNLKTDKNISDVLNQKSEGTFPLLALVVSGGHTMLVLMRGHFQYEIIGETKDDAAGEAFDKIARMLGLPYPGGPAVSQKADAFRERNVQFPSSNFQSNPNDQVPITKLPESNKAIRFPRPMIESGDYDFSFSGLKTAVLYFLKAHEAEMKSERFIDEVCHEFQEAVVDVLVEKTRRALIAYQPRSFTIAGGVSANVRLRGRLTVLIESEFPETALLIPEFRYSLDNAAMIGSAALARFEKLTPEAIAALHANATTLEPDANLPLTR